jgi:hypothetical protein
LSEYIDATHVRLMEQLRELPVPPLPADTSLEDRILSGNLAPSDAFPTHVSVYLSSAGRDSVAERRWLLATVQPALHQWCRARHGLSFELIDLCVHECVCVCVCV